MECRVPYECNAVALARIGDKLRNVAYIVAGGEVDVFTLGILHELAEKAADLEICVFFELSGVDEVEEAVGSADMLDVYLKM